MAKLTKNGVAYDLSDSPYMYKRHGIEFHFSSWKHRIKFIQNVQKREEWLCDSLSRRFHVSFDAKLLACFQLYAMVETRGCFIVFEDGRIVKCLEDLSCQVRV